MDNDQSPLAAWLRGATGRMRSLPADPEKARAERRELIRWAFARPDLLASLSPREQEVLRLRFDEQANELRSLEELGRIFHVTRERIRMVEAKALKAMAKLRAQQASGSADAPP